MGNAENHSRHSVYKYNEMDPKIVSPWEQRKCWKMKRSLEVLEERQKEPKDGYATYLENHLNTY